MVAVVLDAGGEFVFLFPCLEFAVRLELDVVLFGVGVEFARPRCPVKAVAVDAAAAEVEEFGVAFGVAVVGLEAHVPVVADGLFAFDEDVGGTAVPVGPVGADVFAARPVGQGAVGVGDGQAAPH